MMEMPKKDIDSAAAVRRGKLRRRKIMSATIALIFILALVFLFVRRQQNKNGDLGALETTKVKLATIVQVISATGSVTPQTGTQVKIGSQITGRIKRLFADVGSEVRAGQVIAELDLPDIKAQLDQTVANLNASRLRLDQEQSGVSLQQTNVSSDITKAQANTDSAKASYDQAVQNAKLQVNTAEAAVREAQANSKNAQASLKRYRQLLDKGYISAQDVDNAQTQADVAAAKLDSAQQNLELTRSKTDTDVRTALNALENAKAALSSALAGTAQNTIKAQQVAAARAAVKQAEAQVAYSRAQYAKTVIRTPISGTVLALDVQQGETIAAGLSAPTLIRVTDLNRLQVDAFVDETDIGGVHLGQAAKVTVDAYPNRAFRGRVVKIASGATMQQNVVTYDTTVALDNPKGLLKPDMTATVEIVVVERKNVLAVPIEAVKSEKMGQMVYVLEGKEVVPRPVVTGISDDTMTEIRRGLRSGETIVLAGFQTEGAFGRRGMRMTPFGPMGGGRQGGRQSGGASGGTGGRSGGRGGGMGPPP